MNSEGIYAISTFLSPRDAFALLTTCKEYMLTYSSSDFMPNYTQERGHPYDKDISLAQCNSYEQMTLPNLMYLVGKRGDDKVIRYWLGQFKCNIDITDAEDKDAAFCTCKGLIEGNHYDLFVYWTTNFNLPLDYLIKLCKPSSSQSQTDYCKFTLDRVSTDNRSKVLKGIKQCNDVSRWNSATICLLLDEGTKDYDLLLQRACYIGDEKLVNRLIELGANDWDMGLYGAVDGDNVDLAKLMFNKGARLFVEILYLVRSREMTHLLESKEELSYDAILTGAAYAGNIALMDYAMDKGNNSEFNYNSIVIDAILNDKIDAILYLMRKSQTISVSHILDVASENGKLEIIQYFNNGTLSPKQYDSCLSKAIQHEHDECIIYLSHYACHIIIHGLVSLASRGHESGITKVLSHVRIKYPSVFNSFTDTVCNVLTRCCYLRMAKRIESLMKPKH